MFRTKNLLVALLALNLFSCAQQPHKNVSYVPGSMYGINITYDRNGAFFKLELTSFSDKNICISKMDWPAFEGGHYLYGDRQVYFVDRNIRYDLKDIATGYCSSSKKNGCIFSLKKGEVLMGKLSIKDFDVKPEIYSDKDFNPNLQYPYGPHYCDN